MRIEILRPDGNFDEFVTPKIDLTSPDFKNRPSYGWNRAYFCPISGKIWARVIISEALLWMTWSVSYESNTLTKRMHRRLLFEHFDIVLFPQQLLIRELLQYEENIK